MKPGRYLQRQEVVVALQSPQLGLPSHRYSNNHSVRSISQLMLVLVSSGKQGYVLFDENIID